MPLASHVQNAHVIISKMIQPHAYDYAVHCECGWQSHGFANADISKGDEAELARQTARAHLINRHHLTVDKVNNYLELAPFEHAGGMVHHDLKVRIAAHKASANAGGVPIPQAEEKEEEPAPIPQPAEPQTAATAKQPTK